MTKNTVEGGHHWDQKIVHYEERVSSGQGFIIHYVGYIWDSVSDHCRGMRVSSKRGSTVLYMEDIGIVSFVHANSKILYPRQI